MLLLVAALSPLANAGIFDLTADPLNLPKRRAPSEDAVRAISRLPRPALFDLRKLYERYAEVVYKRVEDGWRAGLESGELIEHPEEARLPVRQLEEAAVKREAELKRLEAGVAKAATQAEREQLEDSVSAKASELKKLKKQLARSKGTCADWSDVVWAELSKVRAPDWDLRDASREARPWHTAAVACSPAGSQTPTVCLAFDPWNTGSADVYDFDSWDQGSFDGRIAPEFFLHHLPEDSGS